MEPMKSLLQQQTQKGTVPILLKTIKNNGGKLLQESKVFDLYEGKGIPEGKKSIAFSVTLGDANKTLTDEEVNKVMEKVIAGLQSKHSAELRK